MAEKDTGKTVDAPLPITPAPKQLLINTSGTSVINPHVTYGDDGKMHQLHLGPYGRAVVPAGSTVHDTGIPTLTIQPVV